LIEDKDDRERERERKRGRGAIGAIIYDETVVEVQSTCDGVESDKSKNSQRRYEDAVLLRNRVDGVQQVLRTKNDGRKNLTF
jgi:hypothetical protein